MHHIDSQPNAPAINTIIVVKVGQDLKKVVATRKHSLQLQHVHRRTTVSIELHRMHAGPSLAPSAVQSGTIPCWCTHALSTQHKQLHQLDLAPVDIFEQNEDDKCCGSVIATASTYSLTP
jgi:hypothetical protein